VGAAACRGEKRVEVEEEIRRQVDAIMREELDLLKMVSSAMRNKPCPDQHHVSMSS
jgi:hypothetical protein